MKADYVQLPQFVYEPAEGSITNTIPEKTGQYPIRGSAKTWERVVTSLLALILVVNLILAGGSALASRKLSTTVNELRRADDVSMLPQPDPLVGLKGHPIPEWSGEYSQ